MSRVKYNDLIVKPMTEYQRKAVLRKVGQEMQRVIKACGWTYCRIDISLAGVVGILIHKHQKNQVYMSLNEIGVCTGNYKLTFYVWGQQVNEILTTKDKLVKVVPELITQYVPMIDEENTPELRGETLNFGNKGDVPSVKRIN